MEFRAWTIINVHFVYFKRKSPSLSNSDLSASRIFSSTLVLWIGISSSGRLAVCHLNLAAKDDKFWKI